MMKASRDVSAIYSEDGDAALLHLRTGEWVFLTSVAGYLWSKLETGMSLAQALAAVAADYDVASEDVCKDMQPVIELLREQRMLIVAKDKKWRWLW